MLVMAATYCSRLGLVKKGELQTLLDRTISFLRRLRNISETLEEDCRILETVQQVVFNSNGDSQVSFSSTSS